jgi:hypothetical protein
MTSSLNLNQRIYNFTFSVFCVVWEQQGALVGGETQKMWPHKHPPIAPNRRVSEKPKFTNASLFTDLRDPQIAAPFSKTVRRN